MNELVFIRQKDTAVKQSHNSPLKYDEIYIELYITGWIETNFGGGEDDLLDNLDWLASRGTSSTFSNSNTYYKAWHIAFLFNDVLLLEPVCTNAKFIKWLMDKKDSKTEEKKKKSAQVGW